jgi:biopolymer transport protein ExbB
MRWVLLAGVLCALVSVRLGAADAPGPAAEVAAELGEAKRQLAATQERIISERKALGERLAALARDSAAQQQELAGLNGAAQALPGDAAPARAELARFAAGLAGLAATTPLAESLAGWRAAVEQSLRLTTTIAREEAAVTWWDGSSRKTTVVRLGSVGTAVASPIPALVVPLGAGWRQAGPLVEQKVRDGWIPVDVTGKLIVQATVPRPSLLKRLEEGGWFVLPILFAGLIAVLLVLERILTFRREAGDGPLARQALELVGRGDLEGARRLVGHPSTPTARVIAAGLLVFERGFEARAAALGEAILAETPRVERSLTILGMLAAISPLLGLLGTVSGMIAMFQVLSAHGTGNPKLLSGGISEALITTQLGLLVAVPVLFAHALLVRRAERTLTRIEEQATALASMPAQPAQPALAGPGAGHV